MKKSIMLIIFLSSICFIYAQSNSLVNEGFEDGKALDWSQRGSAVLNVTDETSHSGKFSLLTTGRSQGWNGPSISLTGKIFQGGIYKFSAWVRIKSGTEAEMIMTAERSKGGTQAWDRIVAINSTNGNWINLTGEYQPKNDFDKISVYIESANPTIEYYIDDIIVSTVKEPVKTDALANAGIEKDIPSLFEAYKNYFKIGTCVELDQLQGPEGELVLKHFSSITPENIMKPQYMEISEDNFNFSNSDKLVDFAMKNGKSLRGHTLLWHQQNAKWMFMDKNGKNVSREVLLKRLEKYISTVVGRYKGKIYSWDVVNEVVDGADLRNSEWLEIAGEEYIEKAFIYARKADPKAKLFINDYDTTDPVKGLTLYNLVKKLKERKVPVDGIGMQFHITLTNPGIKAIDESLKKFSELGVEIQITELDMSLNPDAKIKSADASQELLIRQAYRYKEIFDIFKKYKSITNVTFWGFQDGHTWLTNFPVNKSDWPLLFDKNFKAKYAYWGLIDPSKLPGDVELKTSRNDFIGNAVKGTPIIDGIEDDVWKKAPVMNISIAVQGNGATGTGKALWDENNLYVFVKVVDGNLSKKSTNAYEQDSVEIFIDEKNDKSTEYMDGDSQYRINFDNEVSLNGYPTKIKSASVKTKDGYMIEAVIPFKLIKGSSGTKIGFDLQINDDSGSGKRDSITKWNDLTNESYRDTSGFGNLIFKE
jgi:endo-1,4-beta-xylanase